MSGELPRVGVYGIGHFGYALVRHLSEKAGSTIELRAYDRKRRVRETLREERRHPLFTMPARLNDAVRIVDSEQELVADIDLLVLAVTSVSVQEVMEQVSRVGWSGPLSVVNTAKALDFKSGRRLSEVVQETTEQAGLSTHYMVLAGGTIAEDLMVQNPLGMTLAGGHDQALQATKQIFSSANLWIQTSFDLVGVEHAAAFKNVIAICAGVVRGMGLSYGAETHLISRMADEVETFCIHRLRADPRTFRTGSQCWGSDLWMSCTGKTRNRAFGELIGQGLGMDEANAVMQKQHKTIEGVQTLRALDPLVTRYSSDLPLLGIAKSVIVGHQPPQLLIDALMNGGS